MRHPRRIKRFYTGAGLVGALTILMALSPVASFSPLLGVERALAAEPAIGAAVGKPLKQAQDLANAGKYAAALKKTNEANAVPGKSAYESFVIDDFLVFLNVQTRNYAAAAQAGEAALATGQVPTKDRPQRLKTLAQLYYSVKNYPKAVFFAQSYQKEAGSDAELQKLALQARYLQGDFAKVGAEAKSLAVAAQAKGVKPDETVLQLWLSSAFKQQDKQGQREALMLLQSTYPKPSYLRDLLKLVSADLGRSDRMSLEIFRVKLAAGMLQTSDEYMEMAQLAIQLGLPGEAENILSKGFKAGVLGGKNKSREQRLMAMAQKQVAQDEPTLGASAGTSAAKAALGEAYASYGKTDKAISLYRDALASPFDGASLARLHLGQALVAKGDNTAARKVFSSVKGSGLGELASVWILVVGR